MADDSKPETSGRKRLVARKRLAALIFIACLVAAVLVLRAISKEPVDPKRPSTWPVSEEKAVILARGLGRSCPNSTVWQVLDGSRWREAGVWQKSEAGRIEDGETVTFSEAGLLCIRAIQDLKHLQKIGLGAEDAPSSTLYLVVTNKDGECPAGTNYASDLFCLRERNPPNAPDIAP